MEVREAVPKYKRYTYDEYRTLDDDKLWEMIDGVPYAMAAPNRRHQEISVRLLYNLYDFLKGKPCKVYAAPFEVRLNADTYDDTIVLPDIAVICDESKLGEKGCVGAPDMVIEILSPSTAMHDKILKFTQYLRAGVREYWIVNPDSESVTVNILNNGEYEACTYGKNEVVPVYVLEGCLISLSEIFEV